MAAEDDRDPDTVQKEIEEQAAKVLAALQGDPDEDWGKPDRTIVQVAEDLVGEEAPHYFDRFVAPRADVFLQMAKNQGYVPETCLLGGRTAMGEIVEKRDPCAGCHGPREKCGGRPLVVE